MTAFRRAVYGSIVIPPEGLEGPLDAGGLNCQPSVHKRTRACLVCGSTFTLNPCHAKEHVYCSPRCRASHYRQATLFPLTPVPQFDGETIEPEDVPRLAHQLELVRWLMGDGCWRTLSQIGTEIGAPEASVSARLRDLRKTRFGGHKVERKRLSRGLFTYRVQP